ncbi:MAG: LamG domain-containing protein [bacterium]|nr:LamG domain-containing protein [bacterium]
MNLAKKYIKIVLLLIAVPFLIFPANEVSNTRHFSPVPRKSLVNARKISWKGEKAYIISDLSYQENRAPVVTDMILSFNYPAGNLLKDDSKNYAIRSAAYTFIKGRGSLGKGCARFRGKPAGVVSNIENNLWLGRCGDLGSFTIEFRFRALSTKDGSILFSRVGYLSGAKSGIEISLKKGRIISRLYNIFEKENGRTYDIAMNKGRIIRKKRWYHFSLSFDRLSGKLCKYINGKEEEVIFVSRFREPYISVHAPSFGYRNKKGDIICLDSPIVNIGKNYSGDIDEFRITYLDFVNLEKETEIAYKNYRDLKMDGRNPGNTEGIITSPVYRFPATGTKVTLFKWSEVLRNNTFIWMEFRIADNLFYRRSKKPKWYRITNNQRNIFLQKQPDSSFLRGKYYQWRAHLISSPNGRNSPILHKINLDYQVDMPPKKPQFLEVVRAGNSVVRLKWKKNVASDILGYKIYYGVRPGRYDGIITFRNKKRITNSSGKPGNNFIEITLNNSIINENKNRRKRRLLNFPLLKNTVLYFFAVSAYDSYKPGTPYNHESNLSGAVSARPFAGSEIIVK